MAFEGAFEKLFNIIVGEQGLEGGVVVQDALTCIDGLLRFNQSNQVRIIAVMSCMFARPDELSLSICARCAAASRDILPGNRHPVSELFPWLFSPSRAPVTRRLPAEPPVQHTHPTAVRPATMGRPPEACERVARRWADRAARATRRCESRTRMSPPRHRRSLLHYSPRTGCPSPAHDA